MIKDDLKVFVFFLQVAGISEENIRTYVEEFKKFDGAMEEFSREKLVEECETLFLKRILIRFSKVYDDPELRRKISVALDKGFPKNVKGDLHIHTNWSDGTYPLEFYVRKAEELGYKYLAITDHSLVNKGTVQMDAQKFLKQLKSIEEVQKSTPVKIIKGVEMDINENGKLDYSAEVMEKADFILGAVHFDYGKGKEKALELLKILLENEYVKVIAHPLNKIGKDLFGSHLDEIVEIAKRNKKAFEISLVPDRMRESEFLVENLKDKSVKLSLGTDSHSVKQMELMSVASLWLDRLNGNLIANFYDDPLAFLKS
ncbi:PHP domain-containing protein [Mesoaciditoga lauensis]|uniref:PHP domain-containing protein n=1 Tax=Mesoaciditoga lauensis TaxID=1495039 RepID=UPI0005604541|nr:PHP domain-containing protein [Mesoaciditoga lauensis]